MLIKDIMVPEVVLIGPNDRLRDVNDTMKSRGLDPLPVWDGSKVVGMVTQHGIQNFAATTGLAAGSSPVKDAMTADIRSCYEDDDATQAVGDLKSPAEDSGAPGLLVFDRSDQLVGIVSAEDLIAGARRSRVTGAEATAQRKVDFRDDPIDYRSEESFPASDPPPPPSSFSASRDD